ncbi:hypothetical protein M422DRAFT_37030 [Sphaerobolus stellatus SS14]|uniref:Uncharacterized protein n=1 Tax=Sphaerobolus stellatus (strain SS14) TaxID=990650 RepID=A0A0C9UK07_SPHS4|nr:hypothetical protein M422DRAFT_37030 [Sphaerobolus stellatus SS14]
MSTKEGLKLDPGTIPRRKRASVCKCFFFTVAVTAIFLVGVRVVSILSTFRNDLMHPHKWMYQSATLDELEDPGSVVRPLVDRTQAFDIVATVWIRAEATSQIKEAVPPKEVPLFSDTVFQGMTLKDKWAYNEVNLRIPTKVLNSQKLSNMDLRATFALIPNSPSLLEYAVDYSTWIPPSIPRLSVRPLDFPQGSSVKEPSLIDEIIDAYAVNVPLIILKDIKNPCGIRPPSVGEDVSPKDNNDDGGSMEEPTSIPLKKKEPWVLESHPFIVSRSHIRVVDFTMLLNRKAFNQKHKELRSSSCGQGKDVGPKWRKCVPGTYLERGNWETQVRLGILDKSLSKNRTEWAYAPHLSAITNSGPLDLIPVPVNRRNCPTNPLAGNVPIIASDFVNFTWKISYAGRTPPKMTLGNMLSVIGLGKPINMTGTDYEKASHQSEIEVLHALHGQWHHEGSHPRRKATLIASRYFIRFICKVLAVLYWYTLMTTAGISIPGAVLISLADSIKYALLIFHDENSKKSSIPVKIMWSALFSDFPVPALMLKAVLGCSLAWWNGWVPIITIWPASHRERSSRRMDSRTSWIAMALVYLSFAGLYYFLSPGEFDLIPSKGYPDPDPTEPSMISKLEPFTGAPVVWTGQIFQLLLNYRSGTFAGMYKIQTYLTLAISIMSITLRTPIAIGTSPFQDAFTLEILLEFLWAAALAWQAATFAGIPQNFDDLDEE